MGAMKPLARSRRVAPALLVAMLLPGNALAALDGTCTINVTGAGTMMVNPDITVFGSKQSGGQSATASISITPGLVGITCSLIQWFNCFALTTVPPANFATAPSGGGASVSFNSVMRIDGSPMEQPQNVPRVVLNGSHSVEIDLTATKSSGVFAPGDYSAVVTLRCE